MSRFFCDNNDDIKSEIKKENEHSVKNEWRVGSSTYSAWNMLEKSAQSPLKSIPIVGKEQSTTQPCVLISNMNDSRAQFTDTAQAITNEPLYYNVSSRCELEEVVDLPKIFEETSANEDIAQGSETTQCCKVVYNEELALQAHENEEVEAEVQVEDAAEVGASEQVEIEPEAEAEAEPEAEPEPTPETECEFAEAALQAETSEEAQAAEEVEETTTQAEAEVEPEPEPEPMPEYECKFAEPELQAEAVAEDEIEAVPEAEAECKETQATEQPEAEPMPKYEEESETEQIITSQPKTTILDHDVLNVDNVSGYEDEIIQL